MPAGTLLDPDDRARIVERLRRVRPDAKPAWGRLTAPRMLCHLADAMRVAVGDVAAKPTHNFATRTIVRFLVIHTGIAPPRGKIETAPEMLASQPTSWDADVAACAGLVERVGRGTCTAEHPAFGPLSPREWARLTWKHVDHHLRQFGA